MLRGDTNDFVEVVSADVRDQGKVGVVVFAELSHLERVIELILLQELFLAIVVRDDQNLGQRIMGSTLTISFRKSSFEPRTQQLEARSKRRTQGEEGRMTGLVFRLQQRGSQQDRGGRRHQLIP